MNGLIPHKDIVVKDILANHTITAVKDEVKYDAVVKLKKVSRKPLVDPGPMDAKEIPLFLDQLLKFAAVDNQPCGWKWFGLVFSECMSFEDNNQRIIKR